MTCPLLLMALSVLSLNCNGIRDQPKRAGLVQWLRSLHVCVDIVCLQETHFLSLLECSLWFQSSGFSCALSCGSVHSCGCVVLFRPSPSLVNSWGDDDGRYLQCEVMFCGKSFRVCCIYAPNHNPARDQFLDDLQAKVDPSVPTILYGDFNAVFDRSVDRFGSDPSDLSRESLYSLRDLFDACCTVDIWRYLHPSSSSFSWTRWDGSRASRASRIDLCGILYVWVSSVLSCDLLPCPFSDHCSLLTVVSIPDVVPPGPGLWKLNISILQEQAYVLLISDFWASWRSSVLHFPSLADWWDEGKSRIKGLSIRYCCSRSGAWSCNRDLLVHLVDHLKSKVDAGSMSCLGPYHSALSELAVLDSEAARGTQVRARVRWGEEGEISSPYFFRLEKKRSADRWISALRESDGSIVSSPVDLCRSLSLFYLDLFTASDTDRTVLSPPSWGTCHLSSLVIRRLCVRAICQLWRFLLLSSVWPGARLPGWMVCW